MPLELEYRLLYNLNRNILIKISIIKTVAKNYKVITLIYDNWRPGSGRPLSLSDLSYFVYTFEKKFIILFIYFNWNKKTPKVN